MPKKYIRKGYAPHNKGISKFSSIEEKNKCYASELSKKRKFIALGKEQAREIFDKKKRKKDIPTSPGIEESLVKRQEKNLRYASRRREKRRAEKYGTPQLRKTLIDVRNIKPEIVASMDRRKVSVLFTYSCRYVLFFIYY